MLPQDQLSEYTEIRTAATDVLTMPFAATIEPKPVHKTRLRTGSYPNSPKNGSPGIVVAVFEVQGSRNLEDASDGDQEAKVKEMVGKYLDLPNPPEPREVFQADWSQERWARGCFSGVPAVGTWTAYKDAVRKPVGLIHRAGTETATFWCVHGGCV